MPKNPQPEIGYDPQLVQCRLYDWLDGREVTYGCRGTLRHEHHERATVPRYIDCHLEHISKLDRVMDVSQLHIDTIAKSCGLKYCIDCKRYCDRDAHTGRKMLCDCCEEMIDGRHRRKKEASKLDITAEDTTRTQWLTRAREAYAEQQRLNNIAEVNYQIRRIMSDAHVLSRALLTIGIEVDPGNTSGGESGEYMTYHNGEIAFIEDNRPIWQDGSYIFSLNTYGPDARGHGGLVIMQGRCEQCGTAVWSPYLFDIANVYAALANYDGMAKHQCPTDDGEDSVADDETAPVVAPSAEEQLVLAIHRMIADNLRY